MKRLANFLRSVIPADPWQLVFLIGVVLLFISPRLAWWPSKIIESSIVTSNPFLSGAGRFRAGQFIAAFLYPIMFAGIAGYFVCFWPGKAPLRRILWGVCLPTALSLVLILWKFFQISQAARTIVESRSNVVSVLQWFRVNASNFPPGFYFCAFGLILILVYTIRIQLGVTSLPFALPREQAAIEDHLDSWSRLQLLVFVLVGPYFLLVGLFGFVLYGIPYMASSSLSPTFWTLSGRIVTVVDGALLAGISLYVLGKQGRAAARTSLQLPEPRYALFALLLSAGIHVFPALANYLHDRADWAAHHFGQTSPPLFSAYFDVARAWDPWLLLLIFGAVAEEIVFRGVLLQRLTDRYGFHRGILLTGMVWAAIHFRSDHYVGLSIVGVFYHLAYRIFICLAMNYVFAWMTLRWKSIIPAATAHAVSNIFALSGIHELIPFSGELILVAWAMVALLLFHYWPVARIEVPEADSHIPPLEPAL